MSDAVASGIIDAGTLQSFVDVLTPIVDESKIHFNDDGLQVSAVEPAYVAMHEDVSLSTAAFESYESPGAATIGLNLTRLDDLLDMTNSGDLVSFSVDMETRHLQVEFDGVEQSLAMIDPDAIRREPDSPDLDLPNMAVAMGADIDRALSMGEFNSDHIDIIGDPDAEDVLQFHAEGDTDSGAFGLTVDDLVTCQIQTETKSVFSLDYWQELTDATPDDAEVELWFGDEFPARLSWEGCDGHLTVQSLLAPRIQSR